MKRFFKLTLIIGITMIALAISNIAYADDDFDILTPTDYQQNQHQQLHQLQQQLHQAQVLH